MGTAYNYRLLNDFVEKKGEETLQQYKEILLNKTIVQVSETEVDYWITNTIVLNDGYDYQTHFRWASEEEIDEGIEIIIEDQISMKEYFDEKVLNSKIVDVKLGFDRDDYIYIYCTTDKDGTIEIPAFDLNELKDMQYSGEI